MLNPKPNVGKLKNGAFTILFAYFKDGRHLSHIRLEFPLFARLPHVDP